MKHEEIIKRATMVADLIDGLSISDASKIIWEAAQMSGAKGNQHHSMVSARVVADFINHFDSRAGVISIEDGSAVLKIQHENRTFNFRVPML